MKIINFDPNNSVVGASHSEYIAANFFSLLKLQIIEIHIDFYF